jgi:hypothetical protein
MMGSAVEELEIDVANFMEGVGDQGPGNRKDEKIHEQPS